MPGVHAGAPMASYLYRGDLPAGLSLGPVVAIDTETMGLNPARDRLCLVQLSGGDGDAHLVQVPAGPAIAVLLNRFGVLTAPVYCTKIASRLVRTYTDRHGLKDLVRELLEIDISKQQQSSDWGADTLTQAQVEYAASDVLYLHQLKAALDLRLAREGRADLARACFDFLPERARLDLAGWGEIDIFAHS
jgi:ribonuclease D